MKRLFQYSIYPIIMLSAFFILVTGFNTGSNQYLITIPVISFFGLSILLLERLVPYNEDWLKNNKDWNLDLTYYIINYGIKLAAQFLFIWLSTNIRFLSWFPTHLPFWAQVLIALTIIDFFLFLMHWLSHQYEFLWKLHAIHHSSERLYFLNGEKRHALHQIIEGAPGIFSCLLLGAPQQVVVAALALLAINMFMQHTNLDYRAGFLKRLFCVAELHRWHHRADYKDAQVNYGAWLTIWDHIFRTAYDNPKMQSALGAVGIAEDKSFPGNYWKQFLYPFKRKFQQTAKTMLLLGGLTILHTVSFSQTKADAILGNWILDDGSRKISIYKESDKYYGKIYWVSNASKQEEVGKIIFWGLIFKKEEQEWADGQIRLPEMNHSANCFFSLKNINVALVTVFHNRRLKGKTKTLNRILQP